MNPVILPADAEMIRRFYGRAAPWTIHRALVAVHEGEPICIGGVYRANGDFVAFADARPVMREKFRKAGIRMARAVTAMFASLNAPIFARADCRIPGAEHFLERLGFQRLENGGYAWPGS